MQRTLSLFLAVGLALTTIPLAGAQVADPTVTAETTQPVNQTTTVSVTVDGDGTTVVSLSTSGELANASQAATLPDDVVSLLPLGIVPDDPAGYVIDLCNAIVGIVGPYRCS